MDEIGKQQLEQLVLTAPGGIVKLASDEMLTILYASDAFYSLIKNVSDKAIVKPPLSLLRIVYSADVIYVTQQLANQKHRLDNMININFRTLQPDGSFKWVMITGNKTEESYQFGTKTVPVYSCVAMDITYPMVNYKKLEQKNDYYRKITELSKDLFFEYEIATDTLSFTELFREIFGKDAIMQGFRKRLEKTKLIYSEELPAIISIFKSVMNGRKQVRFELRLISKEGNPIWYICYACVIFDENRNPYKVVGKLSTTNHCENEPEKTTAKPSIDSLTGVCTKDSAEVMIAEAIANQEENSVCALFLIDIRNYKNINEIRKSIDADSIFITIGEILRNQFRTSDIIGRMGLNEFIVYMKNIPSDKVAYERADRLCRTIEAIYSYEHTKNGMSASIGIALQKGTQDYQTLMTNANAALIMAKMVSTSSFDIFSGIIN
jgi:diguanylate cyclase (GGDEF)-like protein